MPQVLEEDTRALAQQASLPFKQSSGEVSPLQRGGSAPRSTMPRDHGV
jgi:hypothetical protein